MFAYGRPSQPNYSPWGSSPSGFSYPRYGHRSQPCRSSFVHPFNLVDADEDPEDASYGYSYYDQLRRIEEQRALEEAQARRRAQEEAILAAKREEAARLRAKQEYLARIRQKQYQAERWREAEEQRRRNMMQEAYADQLGNNVWAPLFSSSSSPFEALHSARSCPSRPQQTEQAYQQQPVLQPQTIAITKSQPVEPKMTYAEAIDVIQRHAKSHLAVKHHLSAVDALKRQFEQNKREFVEPASLVFDDSKSTDSAPVLAYSSTNRPFQAYDESLTRLLVSLDAISTEGSQTVKTARKTLAVAIEEELTRLDDLKRAMWNEEKKANEKEQGSPVQAEVVEQTQCDTDTQMDAQNSQLPAVKDEAVSSDPSDHGKDKGFVETPAASPKVFSRPSSVTVSDEDDDDAEMIPLAVQEESKEVMHLDDPKQEMTMDLDTSKTTSDPLPSEALSTSQPIQLRNETMTYEEVPSPAGESTTSHDVSKEAVDDQAADTDTDAKTGPEALQIEQDTASDASSDTSFEML